MRRDRDLGGGDGDERGVMERKKGGGASSAEVKAKSLVLHHVPWGPKIDVSKNAPNSRCRVDGSRSDRLFVPMTGRRGDGGIVK
jgi:hypothetical protein